MPGGAAAARAAFAAVDDAVEDLGLAEGDVPALRTHVEQRAHVAAARAAAGGGNAGVDISVGDPRLRGLGDAAVGPLHAAFATLDDAAGRLGVPPGDVGALRRLLEAERRALPPLGARVKARGLSTAAYLNGL
eukprot:gene51937-24433_t